MMMMMRLLLLSYLVTPYSFYLASYLTISVGSGGAGGGAGCFQ